jgi:ferredoxin
VDDLYRRQRQNSFIVAVQCTRAAETCFCASLGTGPRISDGYDILLTEVVEPDLHVFVAKAGSQLGQDMLDLLDPVPASRELCRKAECAVRRAEIQKRRVDTNRLGEAIYAAFENPRWEEAAARCLCCGNCTQVCPTCFCTSVEDTSDILQESAQRWRRWDSCFTESFSYIHGGSIRLSVKSRYRQRLIHKFAAWEDQFGTLGCTGCGRCITWCPAGIDVVEEIAAVRATGPAATRTEEAGNGHNTGSDTGITTPPIC